MCSAYGLGEILTEFFIWSPLYLVIAIGWWLEVREGRKS